MHHHLAMPKETMHGQMPLYSHQIVRVDIELLQQPQILPHLCILDDLVTPLHLPLLQSLMIPFSASILDIHLIHLLDASHTLVLFMADLAPFMVDLVIGHHLAAKQSLEKPLMLGHFWKLRQMEENAVCFAGMYIKF
jgi:hypothetical protein